MSRFTPYRPLIIVATVMATTLLSAGTAMAQDALPEQFMALSAVSSASRAEVIAEAQAFRRQPNPWSREFKQLVANPQPRATVKAETLRAIQAHEVVNAGEFFSISPAKPSPLALASR